mmetsp:Transcript_39466/g.77069  ORF Transcript_39466/g.77069 Transcript_39466/m.77069 type:complete len:117 (+) Transcript_39466:49-399(+)
MVASPPHNMSCFCFTIHTADHNTSSFSSCHLVQYDRTVGPHVCPASHIDAGATTERSGAFSHGAPTSPARNEGWAQHPVVTLANHPPAGPSIDPSGAVGGGGDRNGRPSRLVVDTG